MLGLVRISVNCQRISNSVIHLERLSEVEKWSLSMTDYLDINQSPAHLRVEMLKSYYLATLSTRTVRCSQLIAISFSSRVANLLKTPADTWVTCIPIHH